MVKCPECGTNFSVKNGKCPMCDFSQVEKDSKDQHVNWVPLRKLPGNVYAEMVKEVLTQNGIPSIIKSDIVSSLLGTKIASASGASAQIFVPEKFKKISEQILLEMMESI